MAAPPAVAIITTLASTHTHRPRHHRRSSSSSPLLLPSSSPPPRTPSHSPHGDERKGIRPPDARHLYLCPHPLSLHLPATKSPFLSPAPLRRPLYSRRPLARSVPSTAILQQQAAQSPSPPLSPPLRSGPTGQLDAARDSHFQPLLTHRTLPKHTDNNAIKQAVQSSRRLCSIHRSCFHHNKHRQGYYRIVSLHRSIIPTPYKLRLQLSPSAQVGNKGSQQVGIASGVRR